MGRVPALGPGGDSLPLLPRKLGEVVIPGQGPRDTSAFPPQHSHHGDEHSEQQQREEQAHSGNRSAARAGGGERRKINPIGVAPDVARPG